MNTKQTETLKLALEALEEINKLSIGENAICLPAEIDGAMDALRSRLAQPEQECWCTTCRPITMADMRFVVCPDCGNKRCPKANDHRNVCTNSNEGGQKRSSWEHVKPLAQPERHELQAKGEHPAPCARHCEATAFQIVIKNLEAQLAQPEQEPVGRLESDPYEGHVFVPRIDGDWSMLGKDLYTAQPQRKPLTDEELADLWYKQSTDWMEFARAIEAAHGIKGS